MAQSRASINPWMAKHGEKAKAWRKVYQYVREVKHCCLGHPDSAIMKKLEEELDYHKNPSSPASKCIHHELGRDGEIKIRAYLDRCLEHVEMAKKMLEKKAAATRKVCYLLYN
ncbi:hypothetical protein HWV62_42225 [Athelia sp. TMB]|nr:hypothetical protein HWV62_42225 [Athelia sp. TMB]